MAWKWDEPSKDRLKDLWAEGYSATVIAEMLTKEFGYPIGRNAVIGARHRWMPDGERKQRTVTRPYGSGRKPRQPKTDRRWGEHKPVPPRSTPRPLWKLDDCDCHYPVQGQGLNTMYCGSRRYHYGNHGSLKPVVFPYCYFHCHTVYKKFDWPPDDEVLDAA